MFEGQSITVAQKQTKERQGNRMKKVSKAKVNVEAVVSKITGKYVVRLNKMAQSECEGWIGFGRLINTYAEEIKQKANRVNPDVDKYLSEHPDSLLHKSQIRNYRQAFKLWKEHGGEEGKVPKVSLTIFTVILNARINPGDVDKFLKTAEEQKLSVSELKALIKGRTIEATENFLFEYNKSLVSATKGLAQAIDSLSKIVSEKPNEPIPEELKQGIVRLLRFSLSKGIVSVSDVNAVVAKGGNNE